MRELEPSSIRNDRLTRQDRSCTREYAASSEVTDSDQHSAENHQFDHVERARLRQRLPEKPKRRLRDRDGPHGSIEIPPLLSFGLRRWPDPRQQPETAKYPTRGCDRQIAGIVDRVRAPMAVPDSIDERRQIQQGVAHDLAPGERVADAAV